VIGWPTFIFFDESVVLSSAGKMVLSGTSVPAPALTPADSSAKKIPDRSAPNKEGRRDIASAFYDALGKRESASGTAP
jgi:hypothetical protein